MIVRGKVLAIAAAATTMFVLSGCEQTETERYKMSVNVETPEGLKSGYAVRELVRRKPSGASLGVGQDRGNTKLRGEAVAIDLPGGQTLYALMIGGDGDADYSSQILYRTELWEKPNGASVELYPTSPASDGLANTNPLPMLVRFRDSRDPKSVERVAPEGLEGAFGPGIRLKQIKIYNTDEDVTYGIGERLKWISERFYFDKMLDGKRLNDGSSLANKLTVYSFEVGEK